MIIKIYGTESLGVRGLSCSVELKTRKIFIDPGIALGWTRHGLLPHPFQISIGAEIKKKIIDELKTSTDVIFSHFDGDHCPLSDPNPYQLGILDIKSSLPDCRIWAKGIDNSPEMQQKRGKELSEILNRDFVNAEGKKDGPLEFSLPVPHGERGSRKSMIMMTWIEEDGVTFVHASDIQLLEERTIEKILSWKPDIVLASGPPLYRYSSPAFTIQRENAWSNAKKLAGNADTLILDHHLLRDEEGIVWLDRLKHTTGNKIFCAAEFMGREPLLLEAWRKELYEWLPVPGDWHENYTGGKVNADQYRARGWEILISKGKIKPCKWFAVCPIREFTENGKLDSYWIENYCLVSNESCVRYQMEEKGKYHPDNMLPDGEIADSLC